MLTLVATSALLAGRVNIVHQVTSDDPRAGPKLASLKGTWRKAVEFQGLKGVATVSYDRKVNENFIKDVRLSGEIPTSDRVPVGLSYDAMHNIKAKQTAYKLTAKSHGAEVVVATPFEEGGPAALCCGKPAVTEVSAARELELGGTRADVFASYNLQEKAARLALDVRAGPGDLGATVEYEVGAEKPDMELSYGADVAPRRNLKATVSADGGVLEYMDAHTERSNGAVWIARASAPFSGATPKLAVRRHWSLNFWLDVAAFGPGELSASAGYDAGAERPAVELSYGADVAPRRNLKATVSADGGVLEYMDAHTERVNGAVWIARASVREGAAPKLAVWRHWDLDL